jgi:proteic killer suppression protein
MSMPRYKLHELKVKEKGTWSVWITENWRITFQFQGPDTIVDAYRDYR